MDKETTHFSLPNQKTDSGNRHKLPGPSIRTLEFIKQVAHNYHVEPKLPDGLRGMMIS